MSRSNKPEVTKEGLHPIMDEKGIKKKNKPKNYFSRSALGLQYTGIPLLDIKNPKLRYLYNFYCIIIMTVFAYGFVITEVIYLLNIKNDVESLLYVMNFFMAHIIGIILFVLIRSCYFYL